jgi:hypothetical protein
MWRGCASCRAAWQASAWRALIDSTHRHSRRAAVFDSCLPTQRVSGPRMAPPTRSRVFLRCCSRAVCRLAYAGRHTPRCSPPAWPVPRCPIAVCD